VNNSRKDKIQKTTPINDPKYNRNVLDDEAAVEKQLRQDPKNIDLWMKLAIIELTIPLVDNFKALECINKVYEIDRHNINALILECWTYIYGLGGIDQRLLEKLSDAKTSDNKSLAIISYLKSWHYWRLGEGNDTEKEQYYLRESILHHPGLIHVYTTLCKIYMEKGKLQEAEETMKKAIENLLLNKEHRVESDDPYDFEDYIDTFFTGMFYADSYYEELNKKLVEIENLRMIHESDNIYLFVKPERRRQS
jgi:tetratricopeptide (TPR) repeat protein